MIVRIVILLAIGAVMQAATSFVTDDPGAVTTSGGALAFGFVLLMAFFGGELVAPLKLPRLTGYIIVGIVVGPGMLGLVDTAMIGDLKLFNGVAIALIALTAGCEIDFKQLRPLMRSIAWITLIAVVGTTALLAGTFLLLRPTLSFFGTLGVAATLSVAFLLAVTSVAQSPAVVVALRDEIGADGPVSRTTLGVVVLADLLVIVMFALASSVARATLSGDADVIATIREVSWELFGSLGVGVVMGVLLTIYLRKVQGDAGLFILTVCFVVAEVGTRVHLDPLLVALAAGILIQNMTEAGHRLVEEIESASLPVYVVFFAVAGANTSLGGAPIAWVPAVVVVLVRASGFLVGTRVAGRIAGAPREVGAYAGYGLLPQAGLALALATILARSFPMLGAEAQNLVLRIVAINQVITPVFFRIALVRSGEAGVRKNREIALDDAADPSASTPGLPLLDPAHDGPATH